jgi:hypothetical protein
MHCHVVRPPQTLSSTKWRVTRNDELDSSIGLKDTPHVSDYLAWLLNVFKGMKAYNAVDGIGVDGRHIAYYVIEVHFSILRGMGTDLNSDALRRTQLCEQSAVPAAKIQGNRVVIRDVEKERGTFFLRHI